MSIKYNVILKIHSKKNHLMVFYCSVLIYISRGQRNSITSRALVWHVANPDWIPGIPYDIPSLQGVIPEYKFRSKFWALPCKAQEENKNSNNNIAIKNSNNNILKGEVCLDLRYIIHNMISHLIILGWMEK